VGYVPCLLVEVRGAEEFFAEGSEVEFCVAGVEEGVH